MPWKIAVRTRRSAGARYLSIITLLVLVAGQAICLSHDHCPGDTRCASHESGFPDGHRGDDDRHAAAAGFHGEPAAHLDGHGAIDRPIAPRRSLDPPPAVAPALSISPFVSGARPGPERGADRVSFSPVDRYGFLFAGRSPTSA